MTPELAPDVPIVSVCIPVKNGEGRIEHCLNSICELDYPKNRIEVIIADGLSTDRTAEIARGLGATVLENPHQTVASGRNIAFSAAKGAFIASTDDDCIVPPDWLRIGLGAFGDSSIGAVGGVSFLPREVPPLAHAANFVFREASRSGYSVQADYLVAGAADDLPGCNVFYRTALYRKLGGFDETLVTGEDVDFHLRIRETGLQLLVAPGLFVWHHKRATVTGLYKQLRRFAEGRVQLTRKHPSTLRPLHMFLGWAWVYCTLIAAAASIWASLFALAMLTMVGWLMLSAYAFSVGERLASALLVPLAAFIMVLGWSTGYIKETVFPMRSTAGR